MKLETALADGKRLDADTHNFGKKVEVTSRACGIWFRKPRTTFWEWYFFGATSPLKRCFTLAQKDQWLDFAGSIFNLEVEQTEGWLGFSREIKVIANVDEYKPTENHFYSFGALLAYCYIFGIRDLHRGNLIMTPTHLQVVDVEVVLTRLILPHETILLPFKQITWLQSGIGALISDPTVIDPNHQAALFRGYLNLFNHVLANQNQIRTQVNADLANNGAPIRVIVRNTTEYYEFLRNHNGDDFLIEEIAQLERGDIPYFFKCIGSTDLQWMKTRTEFSNVQSLGRFKSDIDRHAIRSDELLSPSLLSESRMVSGLMLLLKKLALSCEITIDQNTIINPQYIKVGQTKYQLTQVSP